MAKMLEQCSEYATKFVNSSLAVKSALVPAKLLYSPPVRSVLGTGLDTAGDESIVKCGLAKTRPARTLATGLLSGS